MRVYRVNPEPNDERSASLGIRSEKDAAMLNLQDEVVAWTLFDQRLKNAEHRLFLSSAASSTGIGTSLERFAGRVLSGFGQRLQSSGRPPNVSTSLAAPRRSLPEMRAISTGAAL